ncbi:LysM peptidoglycan-binding domain-containing protein [Opitutales bacterium]|nr:LysM peptidoglycan-binding domain-containing protein [Opitutales bacterium]
MKEENGQSSEYLERKLDKVINLIRYMGLGIIILLGLTIILNQQTRVQELEIRISENTKELKDLKSGFDKNFNELAQQINNSFAQTEPPSRSVISPPSFSTNFPRNGFVHSVEKGESVRSIAEKYSSQYKWIIDANQMIDPSKVFVGRELFIPQE